MAQGPLTSPARIQAVPREMVEKKPPHGSPCNSCGLCCFSSKCDVGRTLFGGPSREGGGPCPALRFETDGKSYCDVMQNPQLYSEHDPDEARAAMMLLMYAGWGCTMRINGEFNGSFDHKLNRFTEDRRDAFNNASRIWKLDHLLPF